jgi:hypothetical protein
VTWKERRIIKYMLALSHRERAALERLAAEERSSAAQVIRRLIYTKAKSRGLWPQGPGWWDPAKGWIPAKEDKGE